MQDARNFYINGQWVAPQAGTDFAVIDPSTEEAYATISLGGAADTEAAVAAAAAAAAVDDDDADADAAAAAATGCRRR